MLYGDRRGGLAGAALLKQWRGWVGGFHSQVLTHSQSCSLHVQPCTDNRGQTQHTSLMNATLTLPLNAGLLKRGPLTHLHLLPVKNGFDGGGLSGSRQQLLQEDQWR